MMSDTEVVRKAVELLWDRAGEATDSPWQQNGRNGIHTVVGSCVATTAQHDDDRRKADALYITLMQPSLAKALAEHLNIMAIRAEQYMDSMPRTKDSQIAERTVREHLTGWPSAISLAEVILKNGGEDSGAPAAGA